MSGNPEWISRYDDAIPQGDLIAEVRGWFAGKTSVELDRIFDSADFCLEKVLLPDEVLGHGQARHRKLVGVEEMKFPGWIDGAPTALLRPVEELKSDEEIEWET